jgi:hypothetical protein
MPIETSDLNDSPALRSSNEGLTGGTGDGNRFVVEDLARGFVPLAPALNGPYDRLDLPYLLGDL